MSRDLLVAPSAHRDDPERRSRDARRTDAAVRDELRLGAGRSAARGGRQSVSGQGARAPDRCAGAAGRASSRAAPRDWRTRRSGRRAACARARAAASATASTCSDCAPTSPPFSRPPMSSCCRRSPKDCRSRCSKRCSPAARSSRATSAKSAAALGHGEAGVLVPPGDPPALAAALDGLLSHPSARAVARRARAQRAAAEYDVSHMVRRYRSIYDDSSVAPRSNNI